MNTILKTRLKPPTSSHRLINRERLNNLFFKDLESANGFLRSCTTIFAPAGFGKTSFLLNIYHELEKRDYKICWLTLASEHNSPVTLMRYLISSIKSQLDNFAPDINDIIDEIDRSGFSKSIYNQIRDNLLVYFLNQLESIDNRLFIFIDELNAIESENTLDLINFIIDNLPGKIHLVIAGRGIPENWPLNRWQSKGKLLALSLQELKFSETEIIDFFRENELPVSDESINKISRLTDGWITGIKLITNLRGYTSNLNESLINKLPASKELIFEYLIEDVLDDIDPDLKDFILQTALLNKFNYDLAAAITGRENSQELIDQVYQKQLFLSKYESQGSWYGYHSVFSEAIKKYLERYNHQIISETYSKATDWFLANNLIDDAVEQALLAENYDQVGEILFDNFKELNTEGKHILIKEWLERIPEEEINNNLKLYLMNLFILNLLSGQHDLIEKKIDYLQDKINQGILNQYPKKEADIYTGIFYLTRFVYANSKGEKLDIKGSPDDLLKKLPANSYWEMLINMVAGNELMLSGQFEQAIKRFNAVRNSYPADDYNFFIQVANLKEIISYWYTGNLYQTEKLSNKLLQQKINSTAINNSLTRFVEMIKGAILTEYNQIEAASQLVYSNLDKIQNSPAITSIKSYSYSFALKHLFSVKDYARAEELLNELDLIEDAVKNAFFSCWNNAWRARLWISDESNTGNCQKAIKYLKAKGINENNEIQLFRDEEFLALARAYLIIDSFDKAKKLLDNILDFSQKYGLIGTELKSRLLYAKLSYRRSQNIDINNIAYILNISLKNEYFRTIIDEGQEIARILAAYKSEVDLLDDDKEELINKIFAELDYKNPEILSEREIEILKKISEGKTNKEIAENLFITLNTVKWHTSNIYSKLSVKNRTEAVREAKKLGLL